MISDPARRTLLFSQLTMPSGTLALLADDQRESLRTLLVNAGRPASDSELVDFKRAVAEVLSPEASGLLIDPLYGLAAVEGSGARASTCGLIVAVDRLVQQPGLPPADTEFDESLDMASYVRGGASGLKLLTLWERGRERDRRLQMARDFTERCSDLGVLSILEGVVRGADGAGWDRDRDVVDAARELGSVRPDLYKAEVPTLGRGSPEEIERVSRRITEALPCPWVALSAGVTADAFPASVEAACRGGASGFLAGRGIWGPSIESYDVRESLMLDAVARIRALVAIVGRVAQPVL